MAEQLEEVGQEKKAVRGGTVAIAAIGICAAALLLTRPLWQKSKEPPVIQGVKEQIEVFEDEDIPAAVLNGVTAVGGPDRPGQTFPVRVRILDQSSGTEAEEYLPGSYRLVYFCAGEEKARPVESTLTVRVADRQGPAILGARDLTVEVGGTVSYRGGVTAVDDVDGAVGLTVDAEQVSLSLPGEYPVVYSAEDARGNVTTVTVTLTVTEGEQDRELPEGTEDRTGGAAVPDQVTQEQLDALADRVLEQILKDGMSQRQKARAIYDYVRSHIKYVGTSDKSSWIKGAYIGLTRGRGDCFNYFACSKELLTRAGIPNLDLSRVGGATDHYWQLVNVGDGWYHFDACPHPNGYPIDSFLLTEAEARDYTERCSGVRTNYYVYDYESCGVTVEGTPESAAPEQPQPPAEEPPAETAQDQKVGGETAA